MAEALLKSVLGNLSSPIGKELGLILGLDHDLKKLVSSLTAIKASIEDAEEKQFSDSSIKDWLQKLKDAVHELDDIMDEYAYEELRLEYEGVKCCLSEMVQSSCLSSFHPMHIVFRYKLAKRVKGISERLDEIAEEKKKYHLTEAVLERSGVTGGRQTSSTIVEHRVYGRAEDKDKIVDFLVGDASHSEDLSVYPIVGLGGLGKTTLAQLIYNHEKIDKHFELKIWVCVSEDFSLKRITKAIIEGASKQACPNLDLELLQRRLQDLLQRKRYLLVLDDVWDHKQPNWQRLKSVLACGARGASILVTTRLPTVAAVMGTMPRHELSMLSDNDCWELFKHQAFAPNEVEQEELVTIGKEIIKKCGGVPLAAKSLGGLLRFKRMEKEWLNVKESNLWNLPQDENSVMTALRLSYLNLPITLRQCFSYCAIFPKDEIIKKQYLIELWMANGFISSTEILDAEDVGDGVWNELYWRAFFQDIEKDEFGKVESFKMHGLVHDLAQSVAEDVCCATYQNGVTTFSEGIHHLSMHGCFLEEVANSVQLNQVKSLRTYILSGNNPHQLSALVFKCYSLRVLDWEITHLKLPLLSSIGQLKHLRYLSLSDNGYYLSSLPESLCKLWNLQTLKLDDCHRLQKLPNNLIRLKALRQLSLNACWALSSLPPQIGKLTSLKNLSRYFVGKESGFLLAELGPLKLKGDLHIKHLDRVKSVKDAKEANMSDKKLNKLQLSWDKTDEYELQENVEQILEVLQPHTPQLQCLEVETYKGAYFPQWMSSPSLKYLTYLKLEDCESCLQLPALGKLPSLKDISMSNMIHVQYIYEESYDGGVVFGALKSLTVDKLPKLIKLSREDCENMFPCLSKLMIFECPEFLVEEILLEGLHTLKQLEIWGCGKFNMSTSFQCLTRLEKLSLASFTEVEGLHEALQHMTALKALQLSDLLNLGCLPDSLGSIPLLQSLRLLSLPKLESLPECFGDLPLLTDLTIGKCSNFKCLPASLSLSNLEELMIYNCHVELEKRCKKETGLDWQKISHIPRILVWP